MSSSVRIFAINGFVSYTPDVVQTSVYFYLRDFQQKIEIDMVTCVEYLSQESLKSLNEKPRSGFLKKRSREAASPVF